MPAYVIEGRHTIYVAAWKKHVGFYAVPKAPSELEQELEQFRSDKDTVKFPFKKPVDWELVEGSWHSCSPRSRTPAPSPRAIRRLIGPFPQTGGNSPGCQWCAPKWKNSATRRNTTCSGMTTVGFPLYSEGPHQNFNSG